MIVIEDKLEAIVNQIPVIDVSGVEVSSYFGYGSEEELNRYIKNSESNNYPLVWLLQNSETQDLTQKLATKNVSIIVATLEERLELSFKQRYGASFKYILNPLVNYVLQGLRNSSVSRLVSNEVTITKFPNYTQEEGTVIDKWDAIRIDAEVEFNNNCLRDIKWLK